MQQGANQLHNYLLELQVNEIASPMADRSLAKKIYKLIRKAAAADKKRFGRGVADVQRMLRKDMKGIVVLAGNVWPVDVYAHLAAVCEAKQVRTQCLAIQLADRLLLHAVARAPGPGQRTAALVDRVHGAARRRLRRALRRGALGHDGHARAHGRVKTRQQWTSTPLLIYDRFIENELFDKNFCLSARGYQDDAPCYLSVLLPKVRAAADAHIDCDKCRQPVLHTLMMMR